MLKPKTASKTEDREGAPAHAPKARIEVPEKEAKERTEKGPLKPARDAAKSRSKSAITPSSANTAPLLAAPVAPPVVGQKLKISLNGKTVQVTVQFIGTTEFAPGEWVGLVLSTPDGKV